MRHEWTTCAAQVDVFNFLNDMEDEWDRSVEDAQEALSSIATVAAEPVQPVVEEPVEASSVADVAKEPAPSAPQMLNRDVVNDVMPNNVKYLLEDWESDEETEVLSLQVKAPETADVNLSLPGDVEEPQNGPADEVKENISNIIERLENGIQ